MAVTYLAVLVGQVFFRAASCGQAVELLSGMIGLHGAFSEESLHRLVFNGGAVGTVAKALLTHGIGFTLDELQLSARLLACFLVCWLMPNTQQIMAEAKPILGRSPSPRRDHCCGSQTLVGPSCPAC